MPPMCMINLRTHTEKRFTMFFSKWILLLTLFVFGCEKPAVGPVQVNPAADESVDPFKPLNPLAGFRTTAPITRAQSPEESTEPHAVLPVEEPKNLLPVELQPEKPELLEPIPVFEVPAIAESQHFTMEPQHIAKEPAQTQETLPTESTEWDRSLPILVADNISFVTPVSSQTVEEASEPVQTTAESAKTTEAPLAEFFVDWPKPKLLLVFTGFMNGYVEPCGCAGMDQMKGGLSRRYTLFKELEKKGWPVMAIDGGNLNKGFGNQEELKYNFVIDESLRLMNYTAAGLGNRELLFPTDVLFLYTVDVPGNPKRYTSANVAVLEFDPSCTMPFRILEENGLKIAVTSVLGQSRIDEINNQDILHEDAVTKLKELLPQMDEQGCDRKVLIVHGTTIEINRILKALPGQFDFILGSDTPAEPPLKPNWIDNSMLIEAGEKGKFAVAVGLFDDPDMPVRYQRIPLDARFVNSPDIIALMKLYQNQLRQIGLEGLGIKPLPNHKTETNGRFVGAKACADCHEPSYAVWRKSRHATAWNSLAKTSNPPRTADPECIACHVDGWNPGEFIPYEHGFLSEKKTPELMNVGCESCHGPGEFHCKAEQGSDEGRQMKFRKAMRLPLEGNVARKLCIECHDGDNSPFFDFDTYWPKIVHEEEEE